MSKQLEVLGSSCPYLCYQICINWVAEIFEDFHKFIVIFPPCLLQSFIPKALEDVKNAEQDVIRLTSGKDTTDMYYKTITGLKQALSLSQPSPPQTEPPLKENSSLDPTAHSNSGEDIIESGTDGDEENSSDAESGSSSEFETQTPIDKKAARKENKKKVKEEKREARKTKLPKAVKKRKKKLAKAHKTR